MKRQPYKGKYLDTMMPQVPITPFLYQEFYQVFLSKVAPSSSWNPSYILPFLNQLAPSLKCNSVMCKGSCCCQTALHFIAFFVLGVFCIPCSFTASLCSQSFKLVEYCCCQTTITPAFFPSRQFAHHAVYIISLFPSFKCPSPLHSTQNTSYGPGGVKKMKFVKISFLIRFHILHSLTASFILIVKIFYFFIFITVALDQYCTIFPFF